MEIFCPSCNKANLFIKEAVYEGFSKVGERLMCAVCKHEMDAAATEVLSADRRPEIFTDEDHPEVFKIEGQDDPMLTCRHCDHYVANPFTQRCSLHGKEVQATDTCAQFTPERPGKDLF